MDLELAPLPRQGRAEAAQPRAVPAGSAPRSRACSARSSTSTQPERRREGADHRDARLRHGGLAELRAAGLRRRRLDVRPDVRAERLRLHRGAVHRLVRRARARRTSRSRSTGARTTSRSPTRASPPAASSPAPRASRPPSSRRCSAAPPASAFDPCYHQACDTIDNLNLTVFGQMKDAAADVLYQLALTKNPIVDGSTPKKSTKKSQKVAKIARAHRRGAKLGRGTFRGETARPRPRIQNSAPGSAGAPISARREPKRLGSSGGCIRSHPRRGGGSRRAARRHARVRPQPRLSGGRFLPWRPSEERDPEESVLELLLELHDRGLCR